MTLKFRGGAGSDAGWFGQPRALGWHGLQRLAADFRKSNTQAGIKPRDSEISLIATLVRGQRIDSDADKAAPFSHCLEESFIRWPHAGESAVFGCHTFLR